MTDSINKKERLLLERIISNRELFVKCIRIIKPEYFEAPLDRVVEFVKDYFNEYSNISKLDVIEAETGVELKSMPLEEMEDQDYVCNELEKFCREQAMMNAVLEGADRINEGDVTSVEALVRDALRVKLDNSLGTELFDDPEERISRMDEKKDHRKIGLDCIDDKIGHIGRGELGVVCAPSGGGKSLMLANIGYYLARQKQRHDPAKHLNVLYISLELDEGLYSKRLDTITTNHDINTHREDAKDIADALSNLSPNMGSMLVKRLPNGTTATEINAFVMEYYIQRGYYPDALMVDYLSGMGVDGMASLVGANKYDTDKVKSEALREIADEHDMYAFTAAQINREGQDMYSGVSAMHIQGGISLVQTSDWTIAMVANQEDIDNNQFKTVEMKLRNAPVTGRMHTGYKNPKTLRINNQPATVTNSGTKRKLGKTNPDKQPDKETKKTPAKVNRRAPEDDNDNPAKSKVKDAMKKLNKR